MNLGELRRKRLFKIFWYFVRNGQKEIIVVV
jgi:hypothetical protein